MRLLLFLGRHGLSVYRRRWRAVEQLGKFPATAEGMAQCESFIAGLRARQAALIIDLPEESFRLERIPFVRDPRDRRAMLERLQERYFRRTEYRFALPRRRSQEGRRDQEVLLGGLASESSLQPWLERLERQLVVAGIYSASIVAERLAERARWRDDFLLVFFLSESAMRHVYYVGGQLRLSRHIVSLDESGHVQGLRKEIFHSLNFIDWHSVNLSASLQLPVRLVSNSGQQLPSLQDEALHCQEIPVPELARHIGLSNQPPQATAEALLVAVFNRWGRWRTHYSSARLQRHYRRYWGQRLFYGLASLCLVALLATAGWQNMEGLLYQRQVARLQQETQRYQQHEKRLIEAAGRQDLDALQVQLLVERIAAIERAIGPSPVLLMRAVAQSLRDFPLLRLDRFEWQHENGVIALLLQGHIEGKDSRRDHIDRFDAFVRTLQGQAAIAAVERRQQPYNLDADSGLSRADLENQKQPDFVLWLRQRGDDA